MPARACGRRNISLRFQLVEDSLAPGKSRTGNHQLPPQIRHQNDLKMLVQGGSSSVSGKSEACTHRWGRRRHASDFESGVGDFRWGQGVSCMKDRFNYLTFFTGLVVFENVERNKMILKIILVGFMLITLVLIAGAALAERGWISGTVTDTYPPPKGQPLSDVAISPTGGVVSVLSNATGYYNISFPVGNYTLWANKSGYADNVSEIVTVYANTTTILNFVMSIPTGQLSGRVTDTFDGAPICDIMILIYFDDVRLEMEDTTDGRGYYHLRGLPAGDVVMHLITYFAYYSMENDANYSVTIQPERTTIKDFRLPPTPVWANVTVMDTKRQGIFCATVILGNIQNHPSYKDGTTLYKIQPGNYTLEVSADGYETIYRNVTVKKNNPGFEVILKKPETPTKGTGGSGTGALAGGMLELIFIPIILIVLMIAVIVIIRKRRKRAIVQAQTTKTPLTLREPPKI